MGQVVEAPHHRVIVPLGGTVSCRNNTKTHKEMQKLCDRQIEEDISLPSPSIVFRKLSEEVE